MPTSATTLVWVAQERRESNIFRLIIYIENRHICILFQRQQVEICKRAITILISPKFVICSQRRNHLNRLPLKCIDKSWLTSKPFLSSPRHPRLSNKHRHGGSRRKQCYVEMCSDGLSNTKHHLAERRRRENNAARRQRRWVWPECH